MANKKRARAFGDQQAVAFVRIGDHPTVGMVDTGTRRTVMNRELAERADAKRTGRTGQMNIAGHRLRGSLMDVEISVPGGGCKAKVAAFVPDENAPFRKGLILGMDFLQAAKMKIDAETGEAYCSPPRGLSGARKRCRRAGPRRK